MKRGQLAPVLIIVLLVAAVGAFYIFSEKRAGQAIVMVQPAPAGITYSREGTNPTPQPTQPPSQPTPPPQPTQAPTPPPQPPSSPASESSTVKESEYEVWKREKPPWPLCRPLAGFDDCNPPPAWAAGQKFVCRKNKCVMD